MRNTAIAAFIALVALIPAAFAEVDAEEASVRLSTAGDLPIEHEAVAQLQRLFEQYNLSRWINTNEVVIQSRAVPHSHPVVTLNTRYVGGDDLSALSTFVHEQGHWYFTARETATHAAIEDLGRLFPESPAPSEGGARNHESTLLHLMVCTLEYDAMVALVGDERARETLANRHVYGWIYARILSDEDGARIRAVMTAHGLNTY